MTRPSRHGGRSASERADGRIPAGERAQDAYERLTPPRPAATQLLTAEQVAERWQVPKSHVWRLARRGEVPALRLGRYVRFRPAAIEAWERAQEVQTDA